MQQVMRMFGSLVKKQKTFRSENRKVFVGAAIQIRTGDLILTKDALYLLSYSSVFRVPDSSDIIARKTHFVNTFF